jgi:hypothetical protein
MRSLLKGALTKIFSFEHSTVSLAARLWKHLGYSGSLIGVSMLIGTLGFHSTGGEHWVDAFLDSAMLLGGMGPVADMATWGAPGKIFAAVFSLYAGLVFLTIAAVLFTPVLHEAMNRLNQRLKQGSHPSTTEPGVPGHD